MPPIFGNDGYLNVPALGTRVGDAVFAGLFVNAEPTNGHPLGVFVETTDGRLIPAALWDIGLAAEAALEISRASKTKTDQRWFLSAGEIEAIRDDQAKMICGGRASDNIARLASNPDRPITEAAATALRAYLMINVAAASQHSVTLDYFAERVDGGRGGAADYRNARRMDCAAQIKAADAALASVDTVVLKPASPATLADVARWYLVEEVNASEVAQRFWGDRAPSSDPVKKAFGMILINAVADRLVTFFGLDRRARKSSRRPTKGDCYNDLVAATAN